MVVILVVVTFAFYFFKYACCKMVSIESAIINQF